MLYLGYVFDYLLAYTIESEKERERKRERERERERESLFFEFVPFPTGIEVRRKVNE